MSKLQQLSKQIDFLVDVQQDSLSECIQEFGSLMAFVEQYSNKHRDNPHIIGGINTIRQTLADNYNKMVKEYEEDLNYLKNQKEVIDVVKALPEDARREEITSLILEEVGELENNDEFIERVQQSNRLARNSFLQLIAEVKEALCEGDIEELASVCQADQMEEANEFYAFDNEDEEHEHEDDEDHEEHGDHAWASKTDCDDEEDEEEESFFDLTNNARIVELLKSFKEPYQAIKTSDDSKKNGSN